MIICRSAAELEQMREVGRLVGDVLTALAAAVAPDVSTADLDALAAKRIAQAGATPDRKSTRLNSSHIQKSRMPSSA